MIEIDHVAPYDFVDDRFWQMAKLVGDDLARVRPGRRCVRIVARPHEIIFAEPIYHAPAARIAKKSRENLILHVLARPSQADGLDQQVELAVEVGVESARRHAGALGDAGDSGRFVSQFGELVEGGLEQGVP